jgi:putative ABC transport system permease protein
MTDWKVEIQKRLAGLQLAPTRENAIIEELSQHLDAVYEEWLSSGSLPAEAWQQTRAELNNSEFLTRELRRVERRSFAESLNYQRRTLMSAGLGQDIRFSLRLLARQPGVVLIAVLTLALGIGAITAIYSVMMTVLVQPLPYKDAERLVWLTNVNASLGGTPTFLNPEDILDFREQAQSFAQIASWGTAPENLSSGSNPERVESIYVTANFFQTLGITPLLGHDFAANEDSETSGSFIISYGLWQRQFGGDPAVIGRKIVLGGHREAPGTIIGVLPPEMNFPLRVDLFSAYHYERSNERGGSHNDRTIARLKPGVTVAQAQAEISAIAARQALQFPDTNKGWDVQVIPFRAHLFGSANTAIPLLFGAALFVLLIAWTNVANLQLTRAAARQKEIAVRLALGAGRWRIVRQLLTESLLLAGGGAALGILLAFVGIKAVRALGPDSLVRLQEVTLDARALVFTLVISILTGIAFGLVPAWQISRPDLNTALKESGRDGMSSLQNRRFHTAFVVAQFALALMLLSGAGLLIRSFWKLQQTSPGFQSEQILAAGVSLNKHEYTPARLIQHYQQEVARLHQLPGVEAAAAISHVPFGGRTFQLNFKLDGQAATSEKNLPLADYRVVTPSLFETLRIPLQQGRALTEQDTTESPVVYLVNEAFARTYSPDRSIIGQRVRLVHHDEMPGEVVGVVGNIKHRNVEADAFPAIYISYLQCQTHPQFPIMHFLVRTRLSPETLAASVRHELSASDPNQVVFYVRLLNEFVTDATAQRRFSMSLLALFALLALLLAALGIYGVMSYAVTRRTRELGVRIALGAQARDVLQLIVGAGLKMALLGLAFGLAGSLLVARVLAGLLFGVGASDPATFISVTLLLLLVALLACWIPARRATRVDPLIALRCE